MRVPRRVIAVTILVGGWAVAQDVDKVALGKECKKGKVDSCLTLAAAVLEADPKQAAGLYKTACDKGSMAGCDNLGLMTAQGLGIDGNDSKAAALFTKACGKKFGPACLHLSSMAAEGFGVPLNLKQAGSLSSKACEYGWALGCEKAAELFRTAAELGPDTTEADRLDAKGKELRAGKAPDPAEGTGAWGDKPR